MTLTDSSGGAPGLAPDTPGAPPGARPPTPTAPSLGARPPELVLTTKEPRYSHTGPPHSTGVESSLLSEGVNSQSVSNSPSSRQTRRGRATAGNISLSH